MSHMSLGGCVGVHLLGVHSESHSDPLLLYLDSFIVYFQQRIDSNRQYTMSSKSYGLQIPKKGFTKKELNKVPSGMYFR